MKKTRIILYRCLICYMMMLLITQIPRAVALPSPIITDISLNDHCILWCINRDTGIVLLRLVPIKGVLSTGHFNQDFSPTSDAYRQSIASKYRKPISMSLMSVMNNLTNRGYKLPLFYHEKKNTEKREITLRLVAQKNHGTTKYGSRTVQRIRLSATNTMIISIHESELQMMPWHNSNGVDIGLLPMVWLYDHADAIKINAVFPGEPYRRLPGSATVDSVATAASVTPHYHATQTLPPGQPLPAPPPLMGIATSLLPVDMNAVAATANFLMNSFMASSDFGAAAGVAPMAMRPLDTSGDLESFLGINLEQLVAEANDFENQEDGGGKDPNAPNVFRPGP